jgi:hypothetical protein
MFTKTRRNELTNNDVMRRSEAFLRTLPSNSFRHAAKSQGICKADGNVKYRPKDSGGQMSNYAGCPISFLTSLVNGADRVRD